MKTITKAFTLGIALLGSLGGFAQSVPSGAGQPDAQFATVYFYQSAPRTWIPIKYWLYDQGKPVGKLSQHSHRQVRFVPGMHTFTTKLAFPTLSASSSLTLSLEAGRTYYIQLDEKFVWLPLKTVLSLTEVVPNPVKLTEINSTREDTPLVSSLD
ncbi:hypothetical protein CLV58_13712 [Spirosoma oryzae]|uniref:DUF2846 domain-containing protein n=1 Tax=Spirosoma oryzae TaxID=1469603 RepID=A0A2T0RWQ8_9BACT|nr:hypothetical protein [Spirosoma oryzae]PRY25611.1 hypothetical protein CLV58_13712 [Spirosoma oryzae]